MRQVTHALLTRPPLSHKENQSEEINSKCFVRLACVKHAASVHPEPGSNSLIKNALLSSRQFQAVDAFFIRDDNTCTRLRRRPAAPASEKNFVHSSFFQVKITTWLSIPFTVYKDLSIVL